MKMENWGYWLVINKRIMRSCYTYLSRLSPGFTFLAGWAFCNSLCLSPSITVWGEVFWKLFYVFNFQVLRILSQDFKRLHSCLPATLCCVHFFIQLSIQQTWPNQRKRFVVLYPGSLSIVWMNYQMIFYHWSVLCLSSES